MSAGILYYLKQSKEPWSNVLLAFYIESCHANLVSIRTDQIKLVQNGTDTAYDIEISSQPKTLFATFVENVSLTKD
jgi:hypothetical protein